MKTFLQKYREGVREVLARCMRHARCHCACTEGWEYELKGWEYGLMICAWLRSDVVSG